MDGDCFINSCFSAMRDFTAEQTKMSTKKYADPKLNAVCRVILHPLPIVFGKLYNYRSPKQIHVFANHSDSEEVETKMVNTKKPQRKKVPIKGTQDEVLDHADKNEIVCQIDLCLHKTKLSSEFITEKSLITPEGLRVIQRTTSSKDEKEIKSLTQYEHTKFEEITLSSDEEDSQTILPVLVPFKPDYPSDSESSASTTDGDMPKISILSNITTTASASDEKELSETNEEKLRNLLASGRFKSKEKSTKLTKPRPLPSRRGKTFRRSEPTSFKKRRSISLRNRIQEDQGMTSYSTSVNEANKKNESSTTYGVNFPPVSPMGNKFHEPIPIHKPLISQRVPVKAKSTATSRNDKFTADLIKSKDMPIKEKKEPSRATWLPHNVITHKATKNLNSVAMTGSSKRKLPLEDDELLTSSANVSNEISPSFKPVIKRVGKAIEKPIRQPTASVKANCALNSSILNLGRSPDGSYGKKKIRESRRAPLCT